MSSQVYVQAHRRRQSQCCGVCRRKLNRDYRDRRNNSKFKIKKKIFRLVAKCNARDTKGIQEKKDLQADACRSFCRNRERLAGYFFSGAPSSSFLPLAWICSG